MHYDWFLATLDKLGLYLVKFSFLDTPSFYSEGVLEGVSLIFVSGRLPGKRNKLSMHDFDPCTSGWAFFSVAIQFARQVN